MSSGPLEYRLEVGRVLYEFGCRIVERGIVDGAYGFARHLVAECEEMRKVILTESGIVTLETAYALLLLGGVFFLQGFGVGDCLYLAAVLLPLFLQFLQFGYGHGVFFCWGGLERI